MITESDLAPLLDAVPSYADRWERNRHETRPDLRVHDLTSSLAIHLAERAAAGDESELDWFFAAVDRLYREGGEDMDALLTVGLLETLIHAAEEERVDLARIAAHIVGAEARSGWEAAYAYTHPDRHPHPSTETSRRNG